MRPRTKGAQSTEKSFRDVMPAHSVLVSPLLTVPQPEPFVDADTAAAFVGITRRTLLQKVRTGKIPGFPLDRSAKKKNGDSNFRS